MEWSSDGYVLAVGWEHGWAIFSIGGRCLASGFGVDEVVDNERFQDAFMHGIKDLVSHRRLQKSLVYLELKKMGVVLGTWQLRVGGACSVKSKQ
jgi:hypothetical protein